MPSDELIELIFTCTSWQKATTMVDELFVASLIMSAEYMPSSASSLVRSINRPESNVSVIILAKISNVELIKENLAANKQLMTIDQNLAVATANICDIN
jgi:response regulator of citrate/malate metabolism